MQPIGVERFAALSADNTGNTRKARSLTKILLPWLLDIQDCCHELSLTHKEIAKLPEFKTVRSDALFNDIL